MRSELRGRIAGLVITCTAGVGLAGCLPPEIDTPPIDPALIEEVTSGGGAGASCVEAAYAGDLTVNGQELPADFIGNCSINGNLTVFVDQPDQLAKVAMVRVVTGQLRVEGSTDKTINLLPNLQSVSDLRFGGNKLANFPEFPKLTTLKKLYMSGVDVPKLKSFENVTSVQHIEIVNCVIPAFQAFNKVEDVASRLDLIGNYATTSFKAFTNLRNGGGYMRIEGLTIGGVNPLSFPALNRVTQLQISNIQQLSKLKLPALEYIQRLELGNLPALVRPDAMPVKDINFLSVHTCPQLNDVDWLPKTTQLSVSANICKSGPNLVAAVQAWVQGSGSTAEITQKNCN